LSKKIFISLILFYYLQLCYTIYAALAKSINACRDIILRFYHLIKYVFSPVVFIFSAVRCKFHASAAWKARAINRRLLINHLSRDYEKLQEQYLRFTHAAIDEISHLAEENDALRRQKSDLEIAIELSELQKQGVF